MQPGVCAVRSGQTFSPASSGSEVCARERCSAFPRVSMRGGKKRKRQKRNYSPRNQRTRAFKRALHLSAARRGEISKTEYGRLNIPPWRGNLSARQRPSVHVQHDGTIDGAEVFLANAGERILHRRGASRISNSTCFPSALFALVTVSPFLSSFLPCIRRFFDSLLVLCMSDSNETAEIHRTENNEAPFRSRDARDTLISPKHFRRDT